MFKSPDILERTCAALAMGGHGIAIIKAAFTNTISLWKMLELDNPQT